MRKKLLGVVVSCWESDDDDWYDDTLSDGYSHDMDW